MARLFWINIIETKIWFLLKLIVCKNLFQFNYSQFALLLVALRILKVQVNHNIFNTIIIRRKNLMPPRNLKKFYVKKLYLVFKINMSIPS